MMPKASSFRAGIRRAFAIVSIVVPAGLDSQAAPPRNERHLRVPLESGTIDVEVNSRTASVTVATPHGTFLDAFPAPAPLAMWADGAATASPGTAVVLRDTSDHKTPFDLTELRLTRLTGDSGSAYRLDATNGAWSGSLDIPSPQARMLFAVLRGDSASGATPVSNALVTTSGDGDMPDPFGTWMGPQLEREVSMRRVPSGTKYPDALRGTGTTGTVRLWFIVDSTGRVRPSSVRLIGRAVPALALAAREDVLRIQYNPAQRRGKPVAQIQMQDFVYAER